MKNNIINELRFASKKKKNAVLGYVYCDYLLDMFEEIERLNNNKDNAINFIDQVLMYHLHDYKQLDEDINTLIGILRGNDK